MTQQEQPTPSFEEALTQLRETVQALEQGNVSLAEAAALFERGVRLAKTCNELLDAAELQVTRLQRELADRTPEPKQGPPRQLFDGDENSFESD